MARRVRVPVSQIAEVLLSIWVVMESMTPPSRWVDSKRVMMASGKRFRA